MSIPGLGQIAPAADPSAAGSGADAPVTERHELQPFWEFRFSVPQGSALTIKLITGTAEKDGTELAPNTPYTFSLTRSKINTWQGCTLEVSSPVASDAISPSPSARYDFHVARIPSPNDAPMVSYLNLHTKLEAMRCAAARQNSSAHPQQQNAMGPRVLITGPPNKGKTTLARTLTAWAMRMGRQPMVVNTDTREGALALPGTLSAAVHAGATDPTTGWGPTPTSGPSATPVKLPLAYFCGLARPSDNLVRYRRLCSVLADAATARLSADAEVRASGMIIDTCAIGQGEEASNDEGGIQDSQLAMDQGDDEQSALDAVAHIAAEFSANVVLVVGGSETMIADLRRRLATGQTTSLGEPVTVVPLDASDGVVRRDSVFLQQVREAAIKDYFFGGPTAPLNPFTQQVDFAAVSVWRIIGVSENKPNDDDDEKAVSKDEDAGEDDDDDNYDPEATVSYSTPAYLTPQQQRQQQLSVEKVEPCLAMQNRALAVLYCDDAAAVSMPSSTLDQTTIESVRDASVTGFVYVADVDEKRRKLRILAPVSARLGDKPLLWGEWPEPMVSLLG